MLKRLSKVPIDIGCAFCAAVAELEDWSDIVNYRLLKDTENSGDTHTILPDD
jgi:hypothetical protein